MMPFMSKRKKFKFQVHLGLEELASVPFVTGVLFAKVRQNDGGSFMDLSSREEVHNNCVQWKNNFEFPCKMMANASSGVLEPCIVRISVRKELKGGRSHQKLGYVDLNLAQFAGGGRMTRRYLLEGYDTKHRQDNSTIKIGVELLLVSGDPVFKVPSNHAVIQSSSLTGHSTDLVDLRHTDNHSEDSLASSSSGFSSLTRRGKIGSAISDSVEMEVPVDGLRHSRSASHLSQHSRGSGTPSSLSSTLERRRKIEESGKEVVVGATRVDAETLVNELIENTDLNSSEVDGAGLQLLVQKDGTMALR